MNNKLLISVEIPSIEEEYDLFIPINRKIGTIKKVILESCAATISTAFVSLSEGLVKLCEDDVDLLAITGAAISSIGTGIVDLTNMVSAKISGDESLKTDYTKQIWDETRSFVSTDYTESMFDSFYKNTSAGRWMKENAYAYDMDNIIEQKINKCSNKFSFKAKKIPTLPKVVDYNSIKDYISNNSYEVIIGYEKTNLDVIKLNLKKNLFNVVMSNDFSIQSNFINLYINNSVVMVAEAESCELYEYTKQNIVHEQNNFNDMFSNILNYENKCYEVYEQNNFNKDVLQGQKFISFIIIGLDGFVNKLSEENKNKLVNSLLN